MIAYKDEDMVSEKNEYPELEKMRRVNHISSQIGQFLEWLGEQGICLAKWEGERLARYNPSITVLLAEYFEIDLGKADREREAILKSIP